MNISMYQATIPVFQHYLGQLNHLLDKAIAHGKEHEIDSQVLVNYRLNPTMLPLTGQVQIASDTAKGCGARLAGIEVPVYEDNETDLEQLKLRVIKTQEFLQSLDEDAINGTEENTIVLEFPNGTYTFKGMPYALHFALPNFLFHVTTAYNILRHAGVDLNKLDYLGGIR